MRTSVRMSCALAAGVLGMWTTQLRAQVESSTADGRRSPTSEVRFSPSSSKDASAPHRQAQVLSLRQRVVTLDLRDVPLRQALNEIALQGEVELVYSRHVVPLERHVSIRVKAVSPTEALKTVLRGTDVDIRTTADGEIVLAKRLKQTTAVDERPIQEGTIIGRVTDVRTGDGVMGASVTVDGTPLATTTRGDGGFRIARVPPGTYTATARRLGYTRASRQITVVGDEEVTVDFALEPTAGILDQVVVTGTVLPTEVKALPTPVNVISENDIALQRPQTMQELLRRAVPTAVSWVPPQSPYNTLFSVRGSSTLTPGPGQMKVFVDGIEAAATSFTQVDPSSVARIEVIRGPQAAAIYGSEAIGGVIQIFTKRGDPSLVRPQVSGEAALAFVQTPYAGYDGVPRQEYRASVRGGGSDMGYHFGAGYSRLDDWLPNGEVSRQSTPSVYGGMNFARGVIGVDVSGRYYTQNGGNNLINPDLLQSGFPPFSKPSYQPHQSRNQTVGVRVSATPRSWWRSAVVVGIDRRTAEIAQTQRRLTTSTDTLLLVSNSVQTKTSIGLNTSVQGLLGAGVSGSLTVGFDHWSLPATQWFTTGALTTTGAIQTAGGRTISATRTITKNTGYFAQVQVGFYDVLFLTGGLRAEQNTDFGDSLGTPVSPRLGLSYVRQMGGSTLKLRTSWGRAIRSPSPGRELGFVTATLVQLPNPELGPERQYGWDAGVDAALGARSSLSLTYYNQTAQNLIQSVVLQTAPTRTQQFQNVGRVRNIGVEIEGTFGIGPIKLNGQYGYARARIEQLAPNYTGDLRVDDQTLLTPKHTAGATLSIAPLAKLTISAGFAYVGTWTNYDNIAQFRCFGATGPCRPTLRDYHTTYPAITKINTGVSYDFTSLLSGFVSVDNLTNNDAYEQSNLSPVMGRITTAGIRLQY